MNEQEFDVCKEIARYDPFMEKALQVDNLTMEQYKAFMPKLFEVMKQRNEKSPVVMFEAVIEELGGLWTASPELPFHGPWHHGIAPAVLIAALKNNGHGFSDEDVMESLKRGLQVPAGACGFHGLCGAGSGPGIAASVVLKANPFVDENRSSALEANANSLKLVAKLGGPRCCRLSSYASITYGIGMLHKMGYDLPRDEMGGRCSVHQRNGQCHGTACPYYPRE
nr:DUF5714 domain-containing protein [Candidatus Sigynarchaeum springense]